MKRTILAASLATAMLPALAANYFIVVPFKDKGTASLAQISVSIAGQSLPAGIVGQPYSGFDLSTLLTVTGDPAFSGAGVSWSLDSGALPAGLSLASNGTISGTPTAAGTSSFTVKATYRTKSGQQAYQIVTGNLVVTLAAANPPQGIVGQAYSFNLGPLLTVTGDSAYNGAGVTWSVVSNTLPAGLYLTTDGYIGGTPTAAGTGSITARATYKNFKGEQSYQVVTANLVVSLAAASLAQPTVNTAYSADFKNSLTVTGDPAYNVSQVQFSASALPAWLQISEAGVLTGTPTAKDTSKTFTVSANYKGTLAQQNYTLPAVAGVGVKNFGSYRAWADGGLATSCQGYASGDSTHDYAGDTGNGVYRISVSGTPKDVYCDMTGGGWTLIMTGAQSVSTAGWYNATSDYNVPATPTNSSTVTWKFADSTINAIPKSKYKLVSLTNYAGTYYADGRCTYAHNTTVSGYCATTYTNEALSAGSRTGNQGGGISDNNGNGYRIFTNNSAGYASYAWCAGAGTSGAGGCGGGGTPTTIQVWVK